MESETTPISKRIPIWRIWTFDNCEMSKTAANQANTPDGQEGKTGQISLRIDPEVINNIEIPASDAYSQ
jgi:hypothetical protein